MNIYVSNLKFTMTEDELKDIFSEFGEVSSAKIITFRDTGRSKGYGFVEMGDEEGQKAIDALNGKEIQGRELRVNIAHERKDRD
jgi:RNA recognition motif-containing protein